jgi:hypothetical protein
MLRYGVSFGCLKFADAQLCLHVEMVSGDISGISREQYVHALYAQLEFATFH